jgi:preprotein translocase subunit Sss1
VGGRTYQEDRLVLNILRKPSTGEYSHVNLTIIKI